MPGLNVRSITAAHVSELLLDEGHMASFAAFQVDEVVGERNTIPVDRLSGTIDRVPIEVSTANSSNSRPAYVNPGDPTPKGNTKMDVLAFVANEYRFAYPMPQNIYESPDAALRALSNLMSTRSGWQVKISTEGELLTILRGQGTAGDNTLATTSSLSGKEWNAYTDGDHDPARDIEAAVLATGGGNAYFGRDVWSALKRSPILTGSGAGSGTEFLTDQQLREKLMGLGLRNIWIPDMDFVNSRPLNLPASLARFHDDTAAVWADGALKKMVFEPFMYDEYEDKDTRQKLFRAIETSVLKVTYKESIVAFTNILL